MTGHEHLVAMRLRGHIPARGVVIDAGQSFTGDAGFWPKVGWPRAFVEVHVDDPVQKLDLTWVVGMRAVLVRQPHYPMRQFSELSKLVLEHGPAVLSCAVIPANDGEEFMVHHWRNGRWAKGWAEEEIDGQPWPTWRDLC